jgi:ferredoxin
VKVVVTVDRRACVANQTCMRTAPGLFELVSSGHSQPTRNAFEEADLPLLQEAEDSCPTGAIHVETADSP